MECIIRTTYYGFNAVPVPYAVVRGTLHIFSITVRFSGTTYTIVDCGGDKYCLTKIFYDNIYDSHAVQHTKIDTLRNLMTCDAVLLTVAEDIGGII